MTRHENEVRTVGSNQGSVTFVLCFLNGTTITYLVRKRASGLVCIAS